MCAFFRFVNSHVVMHDMMSNMMKYVTVIAKCAFQTPGKLVIHVLTVIRVWVRANEWSGPHAIFVGRSSNRKNINHIFFQFIATSFLSTHQS